VNSRGGGQGVSIGQQRHSEASTRLVPQDVLEGQDCKQLCVGLHGAPCSGLDMAGDDWQGA